FFLNITALFIEKILSVVFFRNAGGTPSNKSTSILSSGKPAKARGYVTLQSGFFTGDTIWNISISNGSSVSSSITKTR
ncbi:hypothetical protein P4L24_09040, partial [Bacillus cereus]|nr:hypothetical protein [Bacillus cereus]